MIDADFASRVLGLDPIEEHEFFTVATVEVLIGFHSANTDPESLKRDADLATQRALRVIEQHGSKTITFETRNCESYKVLRLDAQPTPLPGTLPFVRREKRCPECKGSRRFETREENRVTSGPCPACNAAGYVPVNI